MSADLAIFTICASNYLAHASVLGASVREHHPDLTLTVFLLDEPPVHVALPPWINVVPAHTAFEPAEWTHRRCHYSIVEFATSVKPGCFRHLLNQGAQRVIYLDPDIRVFQRVAPFWSGGADDAELVLTPHILSPLPNDGCLPDDLLILRAGLYNLGFAALRDTPRTRALLDWWDDKLHALCLEDIQTGVFTDQKWMEYAPVLVPGMLTLRHLGCNAAYWNLHERTPRYVDGRWVVQGQDGGAQDLVFFHFSGFSPDTLRLSRHDTRFGWDLPGDTRRLCNDYARVLAGAGVAGFQALGVPQVRFADGAAWDWACRALYREALAEKLDLGDPLRDPDFRDWAGSPAPGDGVTRYVRAVMRARGELAARFGHGRGLLGLPAWLRTSGARELGLDAALAMRLSDPAHAPCMSAIYVGYLRSHLGVGEAARNSVAALDAAGVAVQCHDISLQAPAPTGTYAPAHRRWLPGPPVATILGCNADALPGVLSTLPADLPGTYRIGCWYWETPGFPDEWLDRFTQVDEVWAATQFVADAIGAKTTRPVLVMPPMVSPPPAQRDRAWLATLLPEVERDEFVFLFQFDVASVPFRKNPEGVIAAFARAFSPAEPVRLVVKALNGEAAPALMQSLGEAARGQRVSFLTGALESAERFRLLASADGFVSLHRSEGFGLSIAEAMAYGLPVVATGWSGNMDFTHAGNCGLVPCDMVRSGVAHGPYAAGTLWAEPRLDDAARLMRRVWADPGWREEIARAGQATVARKLSARAVGRAMRARLEQIAASAQARQRARQRQQAMPPRAVALLGRMVRDMLRFPGYYLARLPRAPLFLWRHGLADTLRRAEAVTSSTVDLKEQYLLGRILTKFRLRLRRWRYDARRPR